jgi:poly-gamma-glutamate synthesis protein (capsule biosynthesis protein)
MFSSPDEYAVALKEAGFDVFLNANNHILDRFSKGLHRTLDVLDSLQIQHTGVFRNAEERAETYPLIVEKNGIRIAFLNYTYGTNGIKPKYPDVVNYIDKWQIQQDIQKAKCQQADVIIANMHWGIEYKTVQNKEQENTAKFLMEEGVDIVMGSHPHVVQPSILTDSTGAGRRLVVYSLGNFVSGMTAVNTDGGQMIKVVLEKQKDKTVISSCGYILIYTEKTVGANHYSPNHYSPNHHSSHSKIDYSVVPVLQAEQDADYSGNLKMTRFANNARAIFNKYNQGVAEDSLSTVPTPNNEFLLKFFLLKFAK